jgi:uncharacterized membrane protein (DUF2068 family)
LSPAAIARRFSHVAAPPHPALAQWRGDAEIDAAEVTSQAARGLRVVALFEAGKGAVVLIAGFGLLAFVHQDLQRLAEELVAHTHLNPASRYPRIFIELAGRAADVRLWLLATLAFAYAALRLAEAYGLWHARRWAEWLAVASGAIYVPAEIYELVRGPSLLKGVTLAANVGVVAYMARTLWLARREPV